MPARIRLECRNLLSTIRSISIFLAPPPGSSPMGLLILGGLAVSFRCSDGRFRHAMDWPALNERATPGIRRTDVHGAAMRSRGVLVHCRRSLGAAAAVLTAEVQ